MRIVFFPAGGIKFASSRLRVYKITEALRAMGHEVMFNALNSSVCDVAVFQKRYEHQYIEYFKRAGKRVIFDVDDWMASSPIPAGVDQITVDTVAKLELYPDAVVIPDALDLDLLTSPRKTTHSDKLERVVWVGNTQNMYHLRYASRACHALGINLTVITDIGSPHFHKQCEQLHGQDNIKFVQWELESVDRLMVQHDLAIFPLITEGGDWSPEWVKSKSANKVLKAHGLGLPVAATDMQEHAAAGVLYCAQTTEEWCEVLTLLGDRERREANTEENYNKAWEFRAGQVVIEWLKVFEKKT